MSASPTLGPIRRVSSGAPWETAVGYCRAVRRGPFVCVSGTVGIQPDGSAPAGAEAQADRAIAIILEALGRLGASAADVVRTRVYLTRADDFEAVSRAHARGFGAAPPASSMLVIAALARPDLRVEIEADAIVDGPTAGA